MNSNPRRNDDEYSRQSFTFRRMEKWQLWSITIVAIAVIVALVVYVSG